MIRAGVWEGIVTGSGGTEPRILATHDTRPVPGLSLQHNQKDDHWVLSLPIPPEAINEGVQTIVSHFQLWESRRQ